MAAREKDSVAKAPSSESSMNLADFMRMFPTNDACLDYLRDKFYPAGSVCPNLECGRETKFHRITGRSAYGCQFCGRQVYPTAGTIFHKSSTNLTLWFWAIFLMSSTRCGISAKQLEREIGVTYKTALRMFRQIREMLTQDDEPLSGAVEADETYVGGKAKAFPKRSRSEHLARKIPVFGAVERGGRVVAKVMDDSLGRSVRSNLYRHVLPTSTLYTDEASHYTGLQMMLTYKEHHRIAHYTQVYVDGDVHTQTIDGFFAGIKNAIRGVHHGVSQKHLQGYLNEHAFRYNNRDSETSMFWLILDRVQKDRLAAA